jgi:leucyl-tRNA synthetase
VQDYIQTTLSKAERDRKAEDEEIRGVPTGAFAVHPLTQETIPIFIANYVLADYGTGAVMSVPAHDERDFQFSRNMGLPVKIVIKPNSSSSAAAPDCFTQDGVLVNSAEFSGLGSEEARQKITKKLIEIGLGQSRITYKIRDWVFSRQRYWGEPFPLYFDEQGKVIPAKEDELPILLPEMKDFKPSPDGSSPLARAKEWVEVSKGGQKLFRVTDTMPGWAGSCWYYLRFMDPHNSKEAWSKEAIQYWKQVDLYVGGASHAVMHLLYARFWHKALYDLGLVPTKEPFKKLFNQGMVTTFAFKDETGRLVPTQLVEQRGQDFFHIETGLKLERFITAMSKSLRNVVNPETVIAEYGADAFRLYMLFMGPLEAEKPWAHDGIVGCAGFLRKLYHFLYSDEGKLQISSTENPALRKPLHKALKRINDAFELYNFNTAVAALMESLNEIKEAKSQLSANQVSFFARMLHPFAPHMASQIWCDLGQWNSEQLSSYIDYAPWPKLDPNELIENNFELVIQINGKIRKKKKVPMDLSESAAFSLAEEELNPLLKGFSVVRKIFVPKKLVNFVVKPN